MLIYLVNLSFVLFWAIIFKVIKNKNPRRNFVLIVSIQLFLLLALRDFSVGADIVRYIDHFEYVKQLDFNSLNTQRHEIGYVFFSKVVSLLTGNSRHFIVLIAGISVFSISLFIYRYSKLPFLSYFLYITLGFYSFTFSGLRQTLAYSIILFSYKYIRERKILSFLLTVLLASLFHSTALVFIPAYFISLIKLTYKNISFYFIILGISFIFRYRFMRIITSLFYDEYAVYESGAYTIFIVTLVVVTCSLTISKMVIMKDKKAAIDYNLVMVAVVLLALASTGSNVVRVANYYYYFIILLIPNIIISFKDKNLRLILMILTIILTVMQYLYLTPTSHLQIVPYRIF